jgi:hypothetical protein
VEVGFEVEARGMRGMFPIEGHVSGVGMSLGKKDRLERWWMVVGGGKERVSGI